MLSNIGEMGNALVIIGNSVAVDKFYEYQGSYYKVKAVTQPPWLNMCLKFPIYIYITHSSYTFLALTHRYT